MAHYIPKSQTRDNAHQRDTRSNGKSINSSSRGTKAKSSPQPDRRKFDEAMVYLKWIYGIAQSVPGFHIQPFLTRKYIESAKFAACQKFLQATTLVKDASMGLTKTVNGFLKNTADHHSRSVDKFLGQGVSKNVLASGAIPALTRLRAAHADFIFQLNAPGLPDYDAVISAVKKMVEEERKVQEYVRNYRSNVVQMKKAVPPNVPHVLCAQLAAVLVATA
jgi:hypothetical protein